MEPRINHLALLVGLLSIAACNAGVEAAPNSPGAGLPAAETGVDEPPSLAWLGSHTEAGRAPTGWDGRLDGLKTLWHSNGFKSGEGRFENGIRVGPWTLWYDNGRKRWEGTYADGEPVGLQRAWYENGARHYEGTIAGGERDGPFRSWHDNGEAWIKGTYSRGRREGVFRQWDRQGRLDDAESGVYERGRKVE